MDFAPAATTVETVAMVVAVVTDNSLLSGSKASRVATPGLVPVYQKEFTIGLRGLVPWCS